MALLGLWRNSMHNVLSELERCSLPCWSVPDGRIIKAAIPRRWTAIRFVQLRLRKDERGPCALQRHKEKRQIHANPSPTARLSVPPCMSRGT